MFSPHVMLFLCMPSRCCWKQGELKVQWSVKAKLGFGAGLGGGQTIFLLIDIKKIAQR